ncbi:SgrR family transcriptional regulator [Chromobacterium alticapitis]|uniref:ABC transporter n=1 Tax=Chromobacterium alticapitis TaxID=2073169 RepID=A0A2S5DIE2_9NEIS|nr:SgrR family transcriptional regulator [Chromobacterium alticapitis]POZ62758.1 ABC transporter [Chromobacterium alticapitis]
MRPLQHYQRLHRAFPDHDGPIRLADVAEVLCCAPRHAREILKKMETQGWLRWRPGLGRGHPSHLRLLAPPAELQADALRRLLDKGDIEQATRSLSPESRRQLAALLPAYLGAQPSQPQTLRLPFYRPLHSLDPIQINRRTECHLIRQIFDGLTRYDRARKSIAPALAHHWTHDGEWRNWRFHLRPGVFFHHGRALDGEDVRQTLQRLRNEPGPHQGLLPHLQSISLPAPLTVDIALKLPDALLPRRLADSAASILPRDGWPQTSFGRMPIGTGPFRLEVNNDCRATLRAFDRHWKQRPLLDAVDIWIVNDPEIRARLDARVCHPAETVDKPFQRQLEAGCSYLAANPASLNPEQRQALADWLHPAVWQTKLDGDPALGMLPQWKHRPPPALLRQPRLPATLRLVTYQLQTHIELAKATARRLREAGCRIELIVLPYPDFARYDWLERADLLLTGEVMSDDVDFNVCQWLSQDAGFHRWLEAEPKRRTRQAAETLAKEADAGQRWLRYETLARLLVEEASLIPLRHYWQTLEYSPQLRGVTLAQCGWMDFDQVWLAPP